MVPTIYDADVRIPAVARRALRVVVLADTHAPRRWKSCPPPVAAQLRLADVILHAGDVCTAAVLDELSGYAPVLAVVGNNDGPDVAAWGATPTLEADLGGLRVAMIHDSGPAAAGCSGCGAGSPARTWSCSVTRTSPWTPRRAGCGSSTPDRPPTAAASRAAPSACCASRPARLVAAEVIAVT